MAVSNLNSYGEFAASSGLHVGSRYAEILGSLAFVVAIVRGIMHHGGIEATVIQAVGSLALFAGLGYIAGRLAAWIVEDSVRSRWAAELAAKAAAAKNP